MRALIVALATLLAIPVTAWSEQDISARLDQLFGAHAPYEAFLIALKRAVAAEDKEAVADLIAYPLEATIGDRCVVLPSQDRLVERYDDLFTPAVVAAIADLRYAALFANADRVMVGDGELWFSGICGDTSCAEVSVKVITIRP